MGKQRCTCVLIFTRLTYIIIYVIFFVTKHQSGGVIVKKKFAALSLMIILCFSCMLPVSALSANEVTARKRSYYSGINSTISLLSKNLGSLKDISIKRIVITSSKDFTSEDAVKENVVSESTSPTLSFSILVAIQLSASDGNSTQDYLFNHYLAAGSLYNLIPFGSSDLLLYNFNNAISYFDDYGKSIGPGAAYLNSLGERYFFDIDLTDYQNSGYSLSVPLVESVASVEIAPPSTTPSATETAPTVEPVAESVSQVEPASVVSAPSEPITAPTPTPEVPSNPSSVIVSTPSYTKNQTLIISGQTNFDSPYTYTDGSSRYQCFMLTSGNAKWYAAVSTDEYSYFKSAFSNHSLTLEGNYKGSSSDGIPVVFIINLVEGQKKTNLRTYLWNCNKGSAKSPNFSVYATLKGDGFIMTASKDGSSLMIDSNPLSIASPKSQAYKDFLALALLFVKEINSDFGLPDWLYTDIINTRPIDGKQKEVFDYITVNWSYSSSGGLTVIYRKN